MLRGTGGDHGYAGVRRAPEHFTFTFTLGTNGRLPALRRPIEALARPRGSAVIVHDACPGGTEFEPLMGRLSDRARTAACRPCGGRLAIPFDVPHALRPRREGPDCLCQYYAQYTAVKCRWIWRSCTRCCCGRSASALPTPRPPRARAVRHSAPAWATIGADRGASEATWLSRQSAGRLPGRYRVRAPDGAIK